MKRLLPILITIILLIPFFIAERSSAADYRKTKIAVLDFIQNGEFDSDDVGKIVSEWLTTSLVETGRFDVIERRLLQQIVEEQKMGKSGLVDPGSASRIGKLLGVKTVVSGTVQTYGGIYEINARLINVETGSIITAEKISAASTAKLPDLVARISSKIIAHFPLQGYIVKRSGGTIIIDLGHTAGMRNGMLFRVYTEGAPIRHPKTREVLSIERIEKGIIKITDIKNNTSNAIIIRENRGAAIKTGNMITGILAEDEEQALTPPGEQTTETQPATDSQPAATTAPATPPTAAIVSEPPRKPEPKVKKSSKKKIKTARTRATRATPALPTHKYWTLSGHTNDIKCLAVSPDGSLAATGDKNKNIIIWDINAGKQLATLTGHQNDVQSLSFSPDGRLLASGSRDESVIIWNIASSERVMQIKTEDRISTVAYSPDGLYLATGTNSKEFTIWDAKTGSQVRTIKGNEDIASITFSPDSSMILTAGKNRALDLWSMTDGQRIRSFTGHEKDITAALFSPGGRHIVSAGKDRKIIVWDTASGRQVRALSGHEHDIIALAISRDGHRLVSADDQRSGSLIIIRDIADGKESKRIKASKNATTLVLTANGRYLLFSQDKKLLIYRLY